MKFQTDAVLVHLARAQVHFEGAEARRAGSVGSFHSTLPQIAGSLALTLVT